MHKNSLYLILLLLLVTGCSMKNQNSNWRNDCAKNYSITSKEASRCLKKIENDIKDKI